MNQGHLLLSMCSFILLSYYLSLLRLLSSHDHHQLVLPSVLFIHIYERENLTGPASPMGEPWQGQVSSLEPITLIGREGSRHWAWLWAAAGQTSLSLIKRERGIHWEGKASLKDVCTTVCPLPAMSMKVEAHPFSGQSAKNFTYVFLFSIPILHSGLISIL